MRLAILLAISLFIVACSQAPADQAPSLDGNTLPTTETNGDEPEPQLTQPTPPTQVVESRDVATVFDGLPSDVQDILKNGQNNAETKGFQYTLNIREGSYQSTHPAQGARVYQKGNLVKLDLAEPNQKVDPATYASEIYLNLDGKTASGYCSDTVRCKDNIGTRAAGFSSYSFMTPIDWVNQMDDPVKMEEKTVQNRKAIRLDAEVDGKLASIWVDRYSGLPVMVTQGTTIYSYDSFALGVKDGDVTP